MELAWDVAIGIECKESEKLTAKHSNSKELFNTKGKSFLAGGVASGYYALSPYPIYIERGYSSRLIDIDGNEFIDFSLCLGALSVGHAHPLISQKISKQLPSSILFGATSQSSIAVAERLRELYSLPLWRFMNSGTEATRDAIQICRAIKNVDEIIKVEGAYHGQHESVCVSYHPDLDEPHCGSDDAPHSVPSHPGIPSAMNALTHVIPFNSTKCIVEAQIDATPYGKVSCIIVEPILMNCAMILPNETFLKDLRDICDERGIFLIFDEVKTNTTCAYGGATTLFGVKPDIVCLGKSCSGGMPFGGLGMTNEIAKAVACGEPSVNSTFGGNPLAMECCLTTLCDIMTPQSYEQIAKLQELAKTHINKLLTRFGMAGQVIIVGAKGCLVFMDHAPQNYRDWKVNNAHWIDYALHTFLLSHNIWFSGPGEEWTISVQHTESDILALVDCIAQFLELWTSRLG